MSSPQQNHDQILAELRQEFLDEARERIDSMQASLGTTNDDKSDVLIAIRREAHNLKGMGGSFGFPIIGLIAHRLEDYISGLGTLDQRHVSDVDIFLDHLQNIIEAGRDPVENDAGALIRGLPAHPSLEGGESDARNIEILLVSPSRAVSQIVVHALRTQGYRVTTAHTAWEAIEIAVRARPDLIITSAVMSGVSGIDFIRALGAMAVTENLPISILTSFSKDHQELKRLPAKVPVIRMGNSFDEDLAETIAKFSLA